MTDSLSSAHGLFFLNAKFVSLYSSEKLGRASLSTIESLDLPSLSIELLNLKQ
jgi:hypothetical protein